MTIQEAQGASRATGNLIPFGMEPPHNLEAEQALLGAILVNNEAAGRVADIVRAEHFYEPVHGAIYEAARQVIGRGERATPVTLKPYFQNEQALSEVGGATYLVKLTGSAVGIVNAEDYARAVYDSHVRRSIMAVCQAAAAKAHNPRIDETATAQIETLYAELDALRQGSAATKGGWASHTMVLESATNSAERATKQGLGVQTGLADLDRALGGFEAGTITIVAGRPSMGKSAVAQMLATNAAHAGVSSGFVSLEMSHEQIGLREMASRLRIPLERIRRGDLGEHEWQAMVQATAQWGQLPLWIDASAGLTVAQIKDRARTLQRKHGLGLLVIDYLQLIRPDHTYRGNKVAEVAEISGALKALAVELKIPVVVLSQLSREVEHRDDKRPRMSDLRWSGDVEQDADNILLLYRHRYYCPNPDGTAEWEASENVLEVIIAKQRQGMTGTVRVFYDPATSTFANLVR
jgi:replicative DNA helicase